MNTKTEIFSLRGKVSTKEGFRKGVTIAAKKDRRITGLGLDITKSTGMDLFADTFPERFFSLGIAEQNAAAFSAGLALGGLIPVFSTYGVFASLRAADQIRISLCYNNLPCLIGGAHAGISVGPDGATHQALEDIAVMRVMPNMTLVSPCDATQAEIATQTILASISGPVYLRFGREAVPDFSSPEQEFIPGKAQIFKQGSDLSILATGHMTWEALQAAIELEKSGISARVLNFHTIKPIDKSAIIDAASETGLLFTVEEHQISGGFGSAVTEIVCEHFPVPVIRIGMNDCFGESGQPDELIKKYGLCGNSIYNRIIETFN